MTPLILTFSVLFVLIVCVRKDVSVPKIGPQINLKNLDIRSFFNKKLELEQKMDKPTP